MARTCPCPLVIPIDNITNPQIPFESLSCAVQFTFLVNDDLLACIYRDIAAISPTGVPTLFTTNLTAYTQLRLKNGLQLVKIVPGESHDLGQTAEEIQNVRNVLNKYCVPYQEDFVLVVETDPFDPRTEAIIQLLLYCKVDILALYPDEHGHLVLETSNFELTKFILANATTAELCPQNCPLPCKPCVLDRPCKKFCPPKKKKCKPCKKHNKPCKKHHKPCKKHHKKTECKPIKLDEFSDSSSQ